MRDGPDPPPFLSDDPEIDEVLREFGGDPRAAIRALLHDLAVLAEGYEADVSKGFVRGERPGRAPARRG